MNKVKDIHNSNLYGIIVETGCSTAVTSKLMEVSGASNTIYYSLQPYSKNYEKSRYGTFPRSVSKDFISSVLLEEKSNINNEGKINFIFASSWQLPDEKDPLQYAHGWCGIYNKKLDISYYLHYSINRNSRNLVCSEDYRKYIIDVIGEIGTNILYASINGNISELDIIDPNIAILDMAYVNTEVNYDLLLNTLEKSKGDYFLLFDSEEPIRLEDFLRKGDEFIIQKGSFNPLHHGHVDMMDLSLEKHAYAIPTFLISTYRYDKPHVETNELIDRIKQINSFGYTLIICKSVLFYETFSLLKEWSHKKRFLFPIGCDTLNRIYQTDSDYVTETNIKNAGKNRMRIEITLRGYINNIIHNNPNFKFLVFNRAGYKKVDETILYDGITEYIERSDDGVSSTAIREGKIENKLKH